MHKIGIISDTHGMLRPEVMEVLQGSEVIFHAGDINKQKILDDLGQIAPVYVVRGNNDKEWAEQIPETMIAEIHGLRVFMVHNKKMIPKDLKEINLVVYGHSHKYEEKIIDGIQYLNPGSCGPRRFNQEITLAVLYVEDSGEIRIEKIVIPHLGKKQTEEKEGVLHTGKRQSEREGRISTQEGKNVDEETGIPENIVKIIPAIMKEIDAGKSVQSIAKKHKISETLAEEITKMYLTHPGVNVDGILRRIGW